jgi:[glutamine synthetase] adenylyltransferase / [glutamine synthetase]-adenylyl-L-tyrosine phosphorylase
LSDAIGITTEISNVADLSIDSIYRVCCRQLGARLGEPFHLDAQGRWQPTGFCVLGMGKLGGQELNYSSDIDLMFVYGEEGSVFKEPPKTGARAGQNRSSHQYFQRLVEAVVAELSRLTEDGTLFRVDLRLRPEGNRGPLARSLSSYETYYAQWGQTWERMMLIKTRPVAGDPGLGAEFLEMIQPFRYPRSLPERTLAEVGEMKARIESEVVRAGELERNVKLGRGGIREIEFIVQTLQLLNAGRLPFLQNAQTLPTLDQLVRYRLLAPADARSLRESYCFLRDVEHRLQMENNRQTHTLPSDRAALERLARLLGFARLQQFERTLKSHTQAVRAQYLSRVNVPAPVSTLPLPRGFGDADDQWKALLADHGFRQVDQSLGVLHLFVAGPGYVHVSPRTTELAEELVLRLLRLCPRRSSDGSVRFPDPALSDPDRVLARLDSYINASGARATLYESWTSNPSFFDLLLLLFDRSEFLAETAIRTPDLIEDLALSGQLRRRKTAVQIFDDLTHGRDDADQRLWLRRYHQAELMRLGLRDILGLADFEQNLVELSGLADACLQYALEIVLRRHQLKKAPLAIIGLGKLGGTELTYGSDLDLTFVAGPRARNLPLLQRIAAEVMELLSSPSEFGVAFVTDARLRPDGEKGLLVNTVASYEDYYTRRAMLWEIQALSRARPITGDPAAGEALRELALRVTDFSRPNPPASAYHPAWRADIAKMRTRIEKERTPAGKNALAIKTGTGGLVDAEFIAQVLCLAHGWQTPNTLEALERGRDTGALATADADRLIENYRKLRRVEGILRRWSYVGETVLPDDLAPLYRVAVRCGFTSAEAFMQAVGEYRAAIRSAYQAVMAQSGES